MGITYAGIAAGAVILMLAFLTSILIPKPVDDQVEERLGAE